MAFAKLDYGKADKVAMDCPKCGTTGFYKTTGGECIGSLVDLKNAEWRQLVPLEGKIKKCLKCGTKFALDLSQRNTYEIKTSKK